ncbi:MAG: HAD hydrolase family protein [Clostridiales bacterium]|nr:HAD hydrolase family protein [Clostridiales bacterium]
MDRVHLIAIDLDFTALDNLYELNDITAGVLKKLAELGHKVVIATARPPSMTLPHYRRLELDTLAVLCNGADVVDLSKEGSVPETRYLSAPELEKVLSIFPIDIIDKMGLERHDDVYVYGDMSESDYHMELIEQTNSQFFDIGDIPKIDVGRVFLWIKNVPEAAGIIGQLEKMDNISFYYRKARSGKDQIYISIQSILANKWYGVMKVAEHYGIARENIITFGDEINDKMMLEKAELGFVMKNGRDELKRQIGNITRYTNIEGGVGRELIRLFNLPDKI